MIKSKLKKLVVAVAATGVLVLGTPVTPMSPAAAITVSATVPNNYVNVYKCSRFTGTCKYQYTYQANPPYNPNVTSRSYNRYDWCWCWV